MKLISLYLVVAILVVTASALAGCRGNPPRGDYANPVLDAALLDLRAMDAPAGADPVIFARLKAALEIALLENTMAGFKQSSGVPAGQSGKVMNLAYNESTGMLTWTYRNNGDYDVSGEVGVSDITPIALSYLAITNDGLGDDAKEAWIDGDGSGEVAVSDITAIAINFLSQVSAYKVITAESDAGPFAEIARVPFSSVTKTFPPRFSVALPEGIQRFIWVAPVDSNDVQGQLSNPLDFAFPEIESISPAGGVEEEQVTFTAVVSGEPPFTYEWDFGGGATPNTSFEESPTVALSAKGNYVGSLTVTNSAGSDTQSFAISIAGRKFPVSGTVLHLGTGLEGATLTLDSSQSVQSAADGTYSFSEVENGDHAIVATLEGYTFQPATALITVSGAPLTGIDFTATSDYFDVSGTVASDAGSPFPDVNLTLTGGAVPFQTTSLQDGTFAFSNIPNGIYTLTAEKIDITFDPASLEVTGSGEPVGGLDFVGHFACDLQHYPYWSNGLVVHPQIGTNIDIFVQSGEGVPGWTPELETAARAGVVKWNYIGNLWGLFNVRFTDDLQKAEILLSWVSSLGGDTAGLATWSGSGGQIELPMTIDLAVYVQGNPVDAALEEMVAAHECGHTLGIWDHSSYMEDVMYPYAMTGNPSRRDNWTMFTCWHDPPQYTTGGRGPSAAGKERVTFSIACGLDDIHNNN
ncbi:MAG: DUF2012 domain-containing protein [bacterium]|jgi:PKD repeat protein